MLGFNKRITMSDELNSRMELVDNLEASKYEKIRLWLINTITNNDSIVWDEDVNKDEVLEWLSKQRNYEPYARKYDNIIVDSLKEIPSEFSTLVDKHLFELV